MDCFKHSVVLPSTLMTTECSLEGVPCPLFVCESIHMAKINMLCSVFSVVTSTTGLSIILAFSKMYSLLWIMRHLWWTMSRTIMRGHFLVGECVIEARCENSCEPSHLYVRMCCQSKNIKPLYRSLFPCFFRWYFVFSGTYFNIKIPSNFYTWKAKG